MTDFEKLLKIFDESNFEDRLKILNDLITSMSGTSFVCLYVYEEEHKQLRLMVPFDTDKNDETKAKIETAGLNFTSNFEYNGKLAIPLKIDNNLIGLIIVDRDKVLDASQCLQISTLLKILLEQEKEHATMSKLSAMEALDNEIITVNTSVDAMYKKVLDFVVKVLNAERGTIWLIGDKELILSYTSGISSDEILQRRIEIGHGMIGWIVKNKNPLLSTASKTDSRATGDIFSFRVKSAIGVPIIQDNQVIGVIMLMNRKNTDFYRTYRHFDEFDLSLMVSVANRLKMAITQIELYTKLEAENENLKEIQKQREEYISYQIEQVRRMNTLQKILQALRHTQDMKNVYKIVLIGLTSNSGFKFNRALLLEKDENSRVLVAKEWLGPSSGKDVQSSWDSAKADEEKYADFSHYLQEEALRVDLSGGLTSYAKEKVFSYTGDYIFDRVINRSRIVHVTPILSAQRGEEFPELLNLLEVKEFVCVPLVGRRDVYGAIILDNKYTNAPITDDLIDMLGIFSESVGLTIESLKSYAELVDKTINLEKQRASIEYFNNFLTNILENLDVAIMVVSRDNTILEWNNKSSQLFGFQKSNVVGSNMNVLGPAFAEILTVAERVYDTKETINLNDYRFEIEDKKLFLNMIFSPLKEENVNIITGYIAMFEDVTRKHILEIELRNRERLVALGEMSAKIAHEIRNPLSAIGGFAQRAKKLSNDDKMLKYMDIILDETKRLEGMVNQTLEFSRNEQYNDFVLSSINNIVEDCVNVYFEKFELQGVRIELEAANDNPQIKVEPNHLKEVMINLIQNAFEAMNGSGIIKVKVYSDEGNVYVDVWNNGIPIPPDKTDKIFQPFYTTKTYGTGLGLAICRKIIEDEHHGKISVKSDKSGTTFTIRIPKDVDSKGG